jgi:hypothetical protein
MFVCRGPEEYVSNFKILLTVTEEGKEGLECTVYEQLPSDRWRTHKNTVIFSLFLISECPTTSSHLRA